MGIYNKFLDFIGIEEAEDKQEGDPLSCNSSPFPTGLPTQSSEFLGF